jgi:hypothetical protein
MFIQLLIAVQLGCQGTTDHTLTAKCKLAVASFQVVLSSPIKAAATSKVAFGLCNIQPALSNSGRN